MTYRDSVIDGILSVAYLTSARGGGRSLGQALERVGYRVHRPAISESDLLGILRLEPDLVEQWLRYSEDKRTMGGWYVTRHGEIGQVHVPESQVAFDTISEAVATYVLRELDYWAECIRRRKDQQ